MSGSAFLRLKKLKGSGIVAAAARHNKRVIQSEIGGSGNIDPARSRLNESLQGPPAADDVAHLAKELMRAADVGKLRKDAVRAVELIFSLSPGHDIDDRAFFTDCATWAATQFGGASNILSADIHRDESAPHCHLLLLPLINKRMNGSDMVGGKRQMEALHLDFHASVASRHGLRKAPMRLTGASKDAAARSVLQHLMEASDAALRSKVWATIRGAIESDPGPFALALGVVLEAPTKKLRSMTAIFTSKGKGKANEPIPIGFAAPPKPRSLCSVGFAPVTPASTAPERQESMSSSSCEITDLLDGEGGCQRVRDDELDPALFDPDTGEYFQRPPIPVRHQRQAADDWVRAALSGKGQLAN